MTPLPSSRGLKRRLWNLALIVTGGSLAFLLILIPTTELKMKFALAIAAGLLWVAGAFISGNLRLYSLWCLMLTIPLALSKHFGTVLEKLGGESEFRIEISDPFLLILGFFILRDIWLGIRPGIRIPKVTWIYLAIMAQGAIVVIVGPYRTTAAHEIVRMIKVTMLFLVMTNELTSPARILQCAYALTFSALAQSCVGLVEKFQGKLLGLALLGETSAQTVQQLSVESIEGMNVFRVSAFLMHPNLFGIFLAVLLPLAIGGILLKIGILRRAYCLLVVILGVPALIASFSRSGWAGFGASVAVLATIVFLHQGLRPRVLLPAALAGLALLVVGLIYSGPIFKRLFESKAMATIAREELKADAWKLIDQKPWLGWDLNSYALNVAQVMRLGPRQSHKMWGKLFPVVHNTYLLWWAETGIVGLFLNLWVWGYVIWIGLRNLRARNEVLFVLNAACVGGMCAFIVDGFFSFSIRMNSILRVYWVLAAMIMAIFYCSRREASAPLSAAVPLPELADEPVPAGVQSA
jgi:putative inorganic carbon (hco3(-)) transporter